MVGGTTLLVVGLGVDDMVALLRGGGWQAVRVSQLRSDGTRKVAFVRVNSGMVLAVGPSPSGPE